MTPPADQEAVERELRARYDDTCMVCGDRRRRGPEAGYSTVHYPMPTAAPHGGPVAAGNALVLVRTTVPTSSTEPSPSTHGR